MVAKRVVVVFKPIEAAAPRPLDGDPTLLAIAARRARARSEHAATVEHIRATLATDGLDALITDRATPEAFADADLVVSVGGDGTFLHVARALGDQPLLGVNSSPSTSLGHYCAATAESFSRQLAAALAGTLRESELVRIAVTVDGRALPFTALNDALFANVSPAGSTRYALRLGEEAELQLSSGVWIATASGSTAAISSAGGDVMAATDRRLQYLVREPCPDRVGGPRMLGGYRDGAIELVSRSDRNALFLDGDVAPWPVPLGAVARLTPAPSALRVFGYPGGGL
ncbi:MAG: NAD(+) kinase [Actinobacteria bacterium HGW-Actinobacteria-8]|jgi:NAD+ kinase|nr:MAG: NAD(+) kinase [Actinobacteria bacterium HGW-Actinobacteria-8]